MRVKEFPGYSRVMLTKRELDTIVFHQVESWRSALSLLLVSISSLIDRLGRCMWAAQRQARESGVVGVPTRTTGTAETSNSGSF